MIMRPHFRPSHQRRGVPHARKAAKNGMHFGSKVAFVSVAAFLGIFYREQLPSAAHEVISFSRNLRRENAPPAGAYYSGCDDARAAGVAPLYIGEPGYREGMDGDGDGIACEPYR